MSRRYAYAPNIRITYCVIDAYFVYKKKRYYLEHHPYLGPTFYHDKYMDSVNYDIPKIIYRRWRRFIRKRAITLIKGEK